MFELKKCMRYEEMYGVVWEFGWGLMFSLRRLCFLIFLSSCTVVEKNYDFFSLLLLFLPFSILICFTSQ